MSTTTRRRFLRTSALGFPALALQQGLAKKGSPNERIRAGMIGAGGRASRLNRIFAAHPDVEIAGIADVDLRRMRPVAELVGKMQGKKPKTMQDFRPLIDDPTIDVLCVGTPDHWHAIPTILGCKAGKDVYVEKPDGHNIVEGQRMVEAMRKHKRIVQMGSQHRSTTRLQTAMQFCREGGIGRCLFAKGWESTRQGGIGRPPNGKPPAEVDYDLWLGPAPKHPFNPNRFHGRWRWFYDYGTGDLGNDGVHRIDMAFAMLNACLEWEKAPQLHHPRTIHAAGGKWYYDDDQEFPDTMQVTYRYDSPTPRILTYELKLWTPYRQMGETEGAVVYGDKAQLVIGNGGWKAIERGGKVIAEEGGNADATPHVANFIDCVRSRKRPNCDLETIGHRASVLCHAGNLSARLDRSLRLNAQNETFENDEEANALRGRPEWRKPYVLPEV